MAKRFTQPTFGNVRGIGSPLNSVKNLQRRLNRQARAGLVRIDGGKVVAVGESEREAMALRKAVR